MSPSEFFYTVVLRPRPLRVVANAILKRIAREKVNILGAQVCLNPRDPVISGALTLGVYESEEIRFFRENFVAGACFVDVGANVGLYTAMAIRGGAGRILSLEPHPEAHSFLRKTIAANQPMMPCTAVECAAGREAGEQALYSNPENKGDNRLFADPILREKNVIRVERLDVLCQQHGIESIDFLKMDGQGSEMLVLEGAAEVLARSPKCIMMTEFWPYGLRQCGSDPKAYLDLLSAGGRRIARWTGGRLVPIDPAMLISEASGRRYRNLVVRPAEDNGR